MRTPIRLRQGAPVAHLGDVAPRRPRCARRHRARSRGPRRSVGALRCRRTTRPSPASSRAGRGRRARRPSAPGPRPRRQLPAATKKTADLAHSRLGHPGRGWTRSRRSRPSALVRRSATSMLTSGSARPARIRVRAAACGNGWPARQQLGEGGCAPTLPRARPSASMSSAVAGRISGAPPAIAGRITIVSPSRHAGVEPVEHAHVLVVEVHVHVAVEVALLGEQLRLGGRVLLGRAVEDASWETPRRRGRGCSATGAAPRRRWRRTPPPPWRAPGRAAPADLDRAHAAGRLAAQPAPAQNSS